MADATPDATIAPSKLSDLRIFARKFEITSVKTDPARWNRDWEKGLRSLSGQDVYGAFRYALESFFDTQAEPSVVLEELTRRPKKYQEHTKELWDALMADFRTAWMLLDETERKKHLMNGLRAACEFAILGEDSRALSPEINVNSMLKDRGKGFVGFISNFHESLKEADSGALHTLPSDWWAKALDVSDPPADQHISQLLTIARAEFITLFATHSGLSIMSDFAHGSPGMDPVMEMMKVQPGFARMWGQAMLSAPSKPVIRCENCAKSPDMFDGNRKFMLCSVCKAKLSFMVHYCSQACQKENWKTHKKHCGKQKVSKRLKGTINDPFWEHPDVADHLRSLPIDEGDNVPVNAVGFASPDPSYPHSPALQRQVSLLNGDVEADYFLFDEVERPIRILIPSTLLRFNFRTARGDAISVRTQQGIQIMAEYLLKNAAGHRGLSRERILQQFGKEYGEDMIERILEFEKIAEKRGLPPGTTFLDEMDKKMNSAWPAILKLTSKR